MKKLLIRIGMIFIIVSSIMLPITWLLYVSGYDFYDSEPGSDVLNSDEYQDGDIVHIRGEKFGSSGTSEGIEIIYLYSMHRGMRTSDDKYEVIYEPIYFEEPIDSAEEENMHRFMVIRCRVEGSGDNKTIIGLEFYPDSEFWYGALMSFEILFLVIGVVFYFPFSYKILNRGMALENRGVNVMTQPPPSEQMMTEDERFKEQ